MELWYPGAKKRPLGAQAEPKIGTPKVFIIHTMSGYLSGTDSYFRTGGYTGTESHFGVGGSWDGTHDGEVWQWQALDHQADAQYDGNAVATSVETSDGARDDVPWTPKQVEAIIRLGVWWCKQTGNPARLVKAPAEKGFGWHAQFRAWNKAGHDCPGLVRLKQYKEQVVPEIARRVSGTTVPPATTAPPFPGRVLTQPPEMQGADVLAWQRQMVTLGRKLTADGWYGPASELVCRALQKDKGLVVDGEVGPKTWAASFAAPVT